METIATNMANIFVIWISEEKEKEIDAEKIFKEIMTENFPNLVIQIYRFKNLSKTKIG